MMQAHAEQENSVDEMSKPLVRIHAMLLCIIYAMYSDSTSNLVHTSGVAMRFATLHGFHRLHNDDQVNPVVRMKKIKTWSSLYA
jgi:hypothetical protein